MTPRVSVVLCSYNQAEYIQDAVESVLRQTYANTELVVVDNGSTDATHTLLQQYADNPRVRLLLNTDNQAVTKRLNQGIAHSTGDFISILYADDYYLPEKLERQVECFSRLPEEYGVVYGPGYRLNALTGEQWQDPTLRVSGQILEPMLRIYGQGFINPISPLMRRVCFERYPYQEEFFVEGESINLRFAMTFQFHFLDETLVVMRDHETNIGKAVKSNVERLMLVLDKLKSDPDFPPASRRSVEVFRARILRDAGWQSVRVVGDVPWAYRCYRRAVQAEWRQAFHPRTLVGLGLSLVPRWGRAWLNGLGNTLSAAKGNAIYVDRPDIEAG